METIIYKVTGVAFRRITRGKEKGSLKREYGFEEIIINNIERATNIYKHVKNVVAYNCQCSGTYGKVELFIPHIFGDGRLACWPDGGNYISVETWGY